MSLSPNVHELVKREIAAVAPSITTWRRWLHAHPELSNREEETSGWILERLQTLDVESIQTGIGGYGLTALIHGEAENPSEKQRVVALRADMDALPVTEETGLPFASKNKGVMHACGHDAHTAMLLGAAQALSHPDVRSQFAGTIKLIFQGAEEGAPLGERGGAPAMIEDGVLKSPDVDAIFGLHVVPHAPSGILGTREGGIMAAVDRFSIILRGRQAHGASPQESIDPVVASAQLISALQTIASRTIDPNETVVVTVGSVEADGRWNIIPESVTLTGTVRTHSDAVRQLVVSRFDEIVKGISAAMGVEVDLEYLDLNPALMNDVDLTRRMIPTLRSVVGSERCLEIPPWMAGEDFAHYAIQIPAMFYFLGSAPSPDDGLPPSGPIHSPTMRLNESVFPLGAESLAVLALDFLSES